MIWEAIESGGAKGRMKRGIASDGRTMRVLEMSPSWNEDDWCNKEHAGYVVSGRIRLDFKGQESIEASKGQGFLIPSGCAHKATCTKTTRLFLVG